MSIVIEYALVFAVAASLAYLLNLWKFNRSPATTPVAWLLTIPVFLAGTAILTIPDLLAYAQADRARQQRNGAAIIHYRSDLIAFETRIDTPQPAWMRNLETQPSDHPGKEYIRSPVTGDWLEVDAYQPMKINRPMPPQPEPPLKRPTFRFGAGIAAAFLFWGLLRRRSEPAPTPD